MNTLASVPHPEEACYGSRLHCAWHHVDEPDEGAFRCCPECFHVYPAEADLAAAWDASWPDWRLLRELPPGCAYCGHDW